MFVGFEGDDFELASLPCFEERFGISLGDYGKFGDMVQALNMGVEFNEAAEWCDF